MKSRAKHARRCVICGARGTECNHVCGRNHVAWFKMPFCVSHHRQFHELLRIAGVNLEYTPDPHERLVRALQACMVAEWMLTAALHNSSPRSHK